METAKDPLAKVTTFGYDERSLLKKRVSPAAEAGTAYFDHDGAGRVVKQFFTKVGGGADADIDFTYDEVGNLTLVEDDSGADTVQEFDKLDRMTSKTTVAGEVKFTFDASGKRSKTENPSLDKVENFYDSKSGWLERVQINGARENYYHYDDSGMPVKKLLHDSKVQSYYTWDDAGRLEQLDNLDKGAAVLSYFHYTRNAVGAETFVRHESGGLSYFEHDALDRLTHERRVDSTVRNFDKTFGYDATSNRTLDDNGSSGETTYYTHNAANLLTLTKQSPTVNPVTFEYDFAQRMTAQKDAGDQSTYFTYDQRDQPIQLAFKKTTGFADTDREFTFTGTGERAITKKTGFTPTYFSYDGSKVLQERSSTGVADLTYRHNLSFLDAMGSILEIEDAAGIYMAAFDAFGSAVDLVKESDGGRKAQYSNDAFGVTIYSLADIIQGAQAFSPTMRDLNLNNNQIMTSVVGSQLYLAQLALWAPGGVFFSPRGRVFGDSRPKRSSPPSDPRRSRGPRPSAPPSGGGPRTAPPRPDTWLEDLTGPGITGPPCGANVDRWFARELQLQSVRATKTLGKKPDIGDYLNWALMNQRYKDSAYFRFSAGTGCGVSPCGASVTLCGVCIRSAVLGNLVYGFVGQRLGFDPATVVLSPTIFKWASGGKIDMKDHSTYILGYQFGAGTPAPNDSNLCSSFLKALKGNQAGVLPGERRPLGVRNFGRSNTWGDCRPCQQDTREARHGGEEPWGFHHSAAIKGIKHRLPAGKDLMEAWDYLYKGLTGDGSWPS